MRLFSQLVHEDSPREHLEGAAWLAASEPTAPRAVLALAKRSGSSRVEFARSIQDVAMYMRSLVGMWTSKSNDKRRSLGVEHEAGMVQDRLLEHGVHLMTTAHGRRHDLF